MFSSKFLSILILSLVCGIIYLIPNILFVNNTDFRGIPLMNTDAESLYLNKIHGAYWGCTFNCNPFIKEYGFNFPHFDSSISSMILAIPGILMNIDILDLKIVYEFVLPIIIFLLAFLLINRITRDLNISILGSLFLVLGYNLLNFSDLLNIHDLINLFRLRVEENQFLIFSRPVNPQFSSLYFLLYLNILFLAIKKNTRLWYIILGIFFGISFYIYFFTYAYLTVLNLVLIGIYFFRKESDKLKGLVVSFALGMLLAIPVFYQIANLMSHEYYLTIPHEYLRMSHTPDVSLFGVSIFVVCFILLFLVYKRSKIISDEFIFIFSLISACFLTRNEHVLTGLIMQYSHFEMYVFSPILVIVVIYFIKEFLRDNTKSKTSITIIFLLSILCIVNSILIQINLYKNSLDYTIYIQRYIPILEWIKSNSKDSVFIAPESLSQYIPLYSRNYVFWTLYAGQWISKPDRIYDAMSSNTKEKILKNLEKYDIQYIIQDNHNDLLKYSNLKRVYGDNLFTIYKHN